jgi:hypothetical protein
MIAIALAALLLTSDSTAGPVDQLVARQYPKILSELAVEDDEVEKRQQAWVRTTVAGKPYIVAAYSNGSVVAVELLEMRGDDLAVAQLVRDKQLGYDPYLYLIDADGDGQPEVMLQTTLGPRGGMETWLYRVANGQLVAINPVDKFGSSRLGNPDVLDLDGAGKLDIVQKYNIGPSRVDIVWRYDHYVLQDGKYVARAPLDFYQVFEREKGAPVTNTETFSIPASAIGKPYKLSIVNGAADGATARVTAATVTLNGVTIAAPGDFRQARAAWTLPVTLQQTNTLSVRLEGKPADKIAVAIRHD